MSETLGPSRSLNRACSAAITPRVSSTLSVVWVTKATGASSGQVEPDDVLDRRDEMNGRADLSYGPLDLGMAGMADQDQ